MVMQVYRLVISPSILPFYSDCLNVAG